MSFLELFCDVDDFMIRFAPQLRTIQLAAGRQRERQGQLCPSEVMTLLIHFHQSHYRTFKAYDKVAMERVRASASLTRLLWSSVIPNASGSIASRLSMHDAARPVWAGFTASSCTWRSMIVVICWPVVWRLAMWMIGRPFPLW